MLLHVARCSSLLDVSFLWPHSAFRPTPHLLLWSSPGNSEKLSTPLENIQVQRRLSTVSPEMASQETCPPQTLTRCFLQNSHCGSWDVGEVRMSAVGEGLTGDLGLELRILHCFWTAAGKPDRILALGCRTPWYTAHGNR